LNSLHYLVGVRDTLEKEGSSNCPCSARISRAGTGEIRSSPATWISAPAPTLVIKAQDLGLKQIGKVSVVPGSYTSGEHYRLTLSADRQIATVELLTLQRFKNDKVVFAVAE